MTVTFQAVRIAIIVVIFILGPTIVPCRADTTLSDTTFNYPIGYSAPTFNSDPADVTITVSQTVNGNPGTALEIADTWSAPNITFGTDTGVINNFLTYNPSIQGPIQSLSFSVDRYTTLTGGTLGGNASATAFLWQGGHYYFYNATGPAFVAGEFQTVSASGITASAFELFNFATGTVDSTQHPDFSSAGGAIYFGILNAFGHINAEATGGDYDNRYDNLTYDIVSPVVQTPCSSVAPASSQFTFGDRGGSGTVNLGNPPCSWSVTSNQSWVSLPVSSGTGPTFSFTVSANPPPGSVRTAMLSINGGNSPALTVTITQTGLVCTYTITDAAAGFGAGRSFLSSGGGGGINVVAPAGCSWTATPSQSFTTISSSASGNGNGGASYSVAPNSSSNPQSGTIAIAGQEYVINEQPAGSQANSCSASSTASPIRPEGFAERVADVVLQCSGKAPPGGLTGDILISFNTGVSNLLLSTGQTDALLLEDEPSAANLALGTNAFRGILSSVNGTDAVLFPGVQLATVGGGAFSHTWRITNARVNAQALGAGGSVQATISITAPALFSVSSQPTVAFISSASPFSTPASTTGSGQTTQPVSFTEGFATAFEPRLAANQDPSQVGTVYNSESGYVNTAKLGAQTGFATSGARLIVSIANVPAGVSVYAPLAPASGTNAELVSADATGAGGSPVSGAANQQITLTSGAGTATWEVTASNPNTIETLTFNLVLVNPNAVSLAGVTYAGALAPVRTGLAPQLPSTNLPVPRFASSTVTVPPPATVSLSVAPQQQLTAQPELKSALRGAASTPSSNVVGGTVTWTQVQASTDAAAASTAPNVSVGGTLPPTWVITSCTAVDSGGVCPTINPNNPSNSFTAVYPSLSPGQTGTIMLTAQSSSQSSGTVEYSSTIDSDLANSDLATGSFTANFAVSQIGLNVSLTNASNFSQGQTGAQYSVTIANGGNLPTSLPVTVTETLPTGLTLVSMTGTGWTCTLSTSSCTRSDTLAGNSSFPSITVTVSVAPSAPSSVINEVTATTGVLQATGSDTTNITPVTVTAAFFSGQISVGSGVYYLQFPDGHLFGYYNYPAASILYHYYLGFEAFIPGSASDVYLYDFTTGHWWYTSSSLFPYLYDFTLNHWLYYFLPTTSPRSFSDLTTGKIFTM